MDEQMLNPHLQRFLEAIRKNRQADSNTMYRTPLQECNLDNVDCPKCGNTGYLLRTDENGIIWSRECECMKKRVSIRRLSDSGLQDMVRRYSLESYETPTKKHEMIKRKALEFIQTDAPCFMIAGRSGAGKTHICTAICSELIKKNWQTKYMIWRTEAAALKAMVGHDKDEYQKQINRLRNVPALYIDDFFKGSVSEADVNLAFTILNDRYNGSGKKTIISTERSMDELIEIDEAVAGRIAERAKGFVIEAPDENWRLEGR